MPDSPEYLLSALGLTNEQRAAVERGLLPLGRAAALGRLAGEVGHDLANGLFAVLGHVDLLLVDADPDSPAAERLRIVKQTALELKDDLRALLDYANPAHGGESAALDDATRIATALVRHGDAKQLAIDASYPDGSVVVRCPPDELTQAALHLVAAGRAAAGNTGSINVSVTEDGTLRVQPAVNRTLGVVAATRIAVDRGGSVEQDGDGLLLRLPLWVAS